MPPFERKHRSAPNPPAGANICVHKHLPAHAAPVYLWNFSNVLHCSMRAGRRVSILRVAGTPRQKRVWDLSAFTAMCKAVVLTAGSRRTHPVKRTSVCLNTAAAAVRLPAHPPAWLCVARPCILSDAFIRRYFCLPLSGGRLHGRYWLVSGSYRNPAADNVCSNWF